MPPNRLRQKRTCRICTTRSSRQNRTELLLLLLAKSLLVVLCCLQDMYNKIQQTAQNNQKAFNEEQQKQLGPVLEKVRNAIAAVAKAGNYVYIMEKAAGQPLYINEALSKDVTAEVKAQLAKMK